MDKELKVKILDLMIRARCLEERMIKMSKSADGFFWLGGIGEEAFNIPLGLLVKKGQGIEYDYMHFHYRNGGTMLAMGMDPRDELRQMNNRLTDPFSGGRNFCNHFARREWNVVPVTSTIQTQCLTAPGTAIAQKRSDSDGITIVTFGDAGTAEGDFHVGLNWATIPVFSLPDRKPLGTGSPLLFICTNNRYGISTDYYDAHGQSQISEIAAGYGMPTKVIDGNNVEESYAAISEAMEYCRKERKPYFLEAMVSRLNGHSSSSGANRVKTTANPDEVCPGVELDPLYCWRDQLIAEGVIDQSYYQETFDKEVANMRDYLGEIRQEAAPQGSDIYNHIFKAEIEGREPQQYE